MSIIDNWNQSSPSRDYDNVDGTPGGKGRDSVYGDFSDDEAIEEVDATGADEQERAPVFELAKLDYPYR